MAEQYRTSWQKDEIYGVTPQQTGISQTAPPSSGQQDDIYGVTPQQTGVSQAGPSTSRQQEEQLDEKPPALPRRPEFSPTGGSTSQHQHGSTPTSRHQEGQVDEEPPPLPPRTSTGGTTSQHQRGDTQPPSTPTQTKQRITAFMIPLPQPLGPNGLPLAIPQRYMLYLPPAADLLKPSPDSDTKERKRDKLNRRWQHEVRKAKTFNGAVVSLTGIYCASVRGAVYVLGLLQRNELTFLSRLPRKTIGELRFLYDRSSSCSSSSPPGGEVAGSDERRFAEVTAEFERNRRVAKRDFWIATAVLPVAAAVDLAIPVFGGFSEVDMVWMAVTGRAWAAARGITRRLVLAPPGQASPLDDGYGHEEAGGPPARVRFVEHVDDEDDNDDSAGLTSEKRNGRHKKKQKQKDQPVGMSFIPSPSLDQFTLYLRAACHQRNPQAFPLAGAGTQPEEAAVLRSMGWTPEQREDAEDVAWQVRKTTEDLRVAVAKAAKTWDKFCQKYVRNMAGPAEKGKVVDEDDDDDDYV